MPRAVLTFPSGGQHGSYGQCHMFACLSEPCLEVSIEGICLALTTCTKTNFNIKSQFKKKKQNKEKQREKGKGKRTEN